MARLRLCGWFMELSDGSMRKNHVFKFPSNNVNQFRTYCHFYANGNIFIESSNQSVADWPARLVYLRPAKGARNFVCARSRRWLKSNLVVSGNTFAV